MKRFLRLDTDIGGDPDDLCAVRYLGFVQRISRAVQRGLDSHANHVGQPPRFLCASIMPS